MEQKGNMRLSSYDIVMGENHAVVPATDEQKHLRKKRKLGAKKKRPSKSGQPLGRNW